MTGWIVSGVLVAALIIAVMFFVFMPTPSAPYNTAQPGFMELKEPQTPITNIIPTLPTGTGNAADSYSKAMAFYKKHAADINATADAQDESTSFNAATQSADPWAIPNFRICRDLADMVAAGAKQAEMKYTFVMTPKTLRPWFQVKYARDMYQISLGPFQCYQVHVERKEYKQAEKRLQDMFILGWHMFNERALPDMSMQGLDIMIPTLDYMRKLYQVWPEAPKGRIQSITQLSYELTEILENFRQKRRLVWDSLPSSIDSKIDEFYPGDVFAMAENEKDKAWKTQAILCLGSMKYRCVAKRGDTKKVKELINRYLKSDDPLLKAAAETANALSLKQYQGMATDFSDDDE